MIPLNLHVLTVRKHPVLWVKKVNSASSVKFPFRSTESGFIFNIPGTGCKNWLSRAKR
jgi:hypothetical protein